MGDYEVTHLPPTLSDADREYERECLAAMCKIEQQFREAVEPWQKRLADIYARYPMKIIVMPTVKPDEQV